MFQEYLWILASESVSWHVEWIASCLRLSNQLVILPLNASKGFHEVWCKIVKQNTFQLLCAPFGLVFFPRYSQLSSKIVSNVLSQLHWQKPQQRMWNSVGISQMDFRCIKWVVVQNIYSPQERTLWIRTETIWLEEVNIYILPTLVTLLPSNGLPISYQDYNIVFNVNTILHTT